MRKCWIALAVGFGFLVGPMEAEPKFTFVNLQSRANHSLSEGLHGSPVNNFDSMPRGELKFEMSRFMIGDRFLHLMGKKGAADKPVRIKDIKVNAKFDRLHILHSAGHGEAPKIEDGTEIGAYTLFYEGGHEERIPIIYGEDVRDWWDWPDRPTLTRAKVAWTGTNAQAHANERKIRAFAVIWNNPHPDRVVKSIDVTSRETACDPMIFALTLERK